MLKKISYYNQLLINFYIMVVMYSRHDFYETADCFLSYYCGMTEYMAHFVDCAHWLLKQCIVGKLQHHFYDTDYIFLFLIGFCPIIFIFYICPLLSMQNVTLYSKCSFVLFHHVCVYMCNHLKNKSPVVQYFAMFASPDYTVTYVFTGFY